MKVVELSYAKRWNDLDWDALVRYHSISRGASSDADVDLQELMERMQEFEVVSGFEVVGMGCSPTPTLPKGEGEWEKMKWLEKEVGERGSCVWMRRRGEGQGARGEEQEETIYVMGKEEFVRSVREATAWLEKKEGLLKLPEKWIVIGGDTFALPALVGNDDRVVRYGQYGDMQMYMLGMMGIIGRSEEQGARSEDLEQMRMYRNGFLSTLLLPTVVEKREDGSERRKVLKYDRNEREFVAEKMDKAPVWLFSLLWHLVQSCLAYYHGRFPDLISGGGTSKNGKGKNTDMYVAKLGTDNAVMKYAGYPSVEVVNEEPIGVILERLDAMAKESKEWERARRKK